MEQGAFDSFEQEVGLITVAARTNAPTEDPNSPFFGLPYDDFISAVRALRDEIERRAYLAVVAETEGVVQRDFRARSRGRPRVLLSKQAKHAMAREKDGKRLEFEKILERWQEVSEIRKSTISEFKQLLSHRHWLAHGRYFPRPTAVPLDPGFAQQRARAMLNELKRLDPAFPLG